MKEDDFFSPLNMGDFPPGGPLPVINGVITPISRVITPIISIYKAIYRDPKTPHYNW